METSKRDSSPKGDPSKKNYRSPELLIYGDIRQITQGTTMTGLTPDGMTTGNTKT